MQSVFEKYINSVRNLTGCLDFEFYQTCEEIFFKNFETTPPSSVSGIIVGVWDFQRSRIVKESGGTLFISTGAPSHVDECSFKTTMLNKLKDLQKKENLLWIRVPLIAGRRDLTNSLIDAFRPVMVFILKKLLECNQKHIPILNLGINSHTFVTKCLESTNRPKFVLLPSVHPTFFQTVYEDIKQCYSINKKNRLLEIQKQEMEKFNECLILFCTMLTNL